MKKITIITAKAAMIDFKAGRSRWCLMFSPKSLYLGMRQTWLNRERDDD